MKKELRLKDFAGQKCEVRVFLDEGCPRSEFRSVEGFGPPVLTKEKLMQLIQLMDSFERMPEYE